MNNTQSEQKIRELENALTQAERTNDVETLNMLLSDQFTGVSIRGLRMDKQGFLAAFSGGFKFLSLEIEDLTITQFEAFCSVVGRSIFEIDAHGTIISASACYLDVWKEEDGEWKLVSSSVTPEKKEH